jgi:hypothetical protein
MITIEFTPEAVDEVRSLASAYPDQVRLMNVRKADGGGALTFLIGTSALLVPVIKAVVVAKIQEGRVKSFKSKGFSITNAKASDIAMLLEKIHGLEEKR